MADSKKKKDDLYKVLGLSKECTASELRNAYKKLALRWHPDRCSASEEAKTKFQAIQQAYSVLSDSNKRMMYDVGVYDSDDDDCEMGEFLDEMVAMMDEAKPTGEESLEELMDLFEEMFEENKEESAERFSSASSSTTGVCSYTESKKNSGEGKAGESFNLATHFQGFSMGVGDGERRERRKTRAKARKQEQRTEETLEVEAAEEKLLASRPSTMESRLKVSGSQLIFFPASLYC